MGFICVHIAQPVCIIGYCPCILRRTGRKAMVKGRGGGRGDQWRGALPIQVESRFGPTLLRGRLATAKMLLAVYLRAHGQISVITYCFIQSLILCRCLIICCRRLLYPDLNQLIKFRYRNFHLVFPFCLFLLVCMFLLCCFLNSMSSPCVFTCQFSIGFFEQKVGLAYLYFYHIDFFLAIFQLSTLREVKSKDLARVGFDHFYKVTQNHTLPTPSCFPLQD